jgi:YHS domain-containing protein
MEPVNSLIDRIDAEFSAAEKRANQLKTHHIKEFQDRQQRLEGFEQTLEELRDVWRPRLEALAQKFGQRVDLLPVVEPGRRSASFEFKSELARIKLRFSVAPDAQVQNLVLNYDLDIVPILMKFDSHDELQLPLDAIDKVALASWIDDRIVSFVHTYLSLHENEYYLQDHMVEDPVAKVRFPKYAAGATLEAEGKKYYFIDEATRQEFQKKQANHGQKA